MTPYQKKSQELAEARGALKTFLDSMKDADGNPKPDFMSADNQDALKSKKDKITALDTECKALEQFDAISAENDAQIKALDAVAGRRFQTDGESVKPSAIKAYALPRHSSVKNFKSDTIAGGRSAEEKAYRFGRVAMATLLNHTKSLLFCKEHGLEIKAMSEGTNTAGGFLVQDEFVNDIIDLREQYGVFRRNTKVVPMGSEAKNITRRTGGLTAAWVSEGGTITASDKSWDQVKLVAKKLACIAVMSTEIDEDSVINLGDDLMGEMAYQFAYQEDLAGFTGDGTSTYGGIVGFTNKFLSLSSTRANIAGTYVGFGNNPSEIILNDLINVAALLPNYVPGNRKKWYMHNSFYWNVCVRLALAAGGVTENEIMATAYTDNPKFLSYPVEFTQVMPSAIGDPALTDKVSVLFGDLSAASKLGDRRQITYLPSEHYKFDTDQLAIRATERLDIIVHDIGNADATAANRVPGPVVALLMKAS